MEELTDCNYLRGVYRSHNNGVIIGRYISKCNDSEKMYKFSTSVKHFDPDFAAGVEIGYTTALSMECTDEMAKDFSRAFVVIKHRSLYLHCNRYNWLNDYH